MGNRRRRVWQRLWWWPWRWLGLDRNPLRRGSDRLESVSKIAACALVGAAVVLGVQLGGTVYHGQRHTAATYPSQYHRVQAVVTSGTSPSVVPAWSTQAVARWTGPHGQAHSSVVPAGANVRTGDTLPIWVNGKGLPVDAPPTGFSVVAAAVTTGASVVTGAIMLVVILLALVKHFLDAARARQWEQQWELVSLRWSDSR